MATSAIQNNGASAAAGAAGALAAGSGANSEDRFLKLLVAQMQNQDPLNPMDNAQVTSQMAQIQTVSGIDKLNSTVQGLNAQFAQLQALSGASLVGRDVLIEGNRLVADEGVGHGGFELASQADQVKLEVLDASGRVIDSADLGAMASGRHSFDWTPAAGVDPAQAVRFRISANLGTTAVTATTFTRDRVDAVSAGPNGLVLELANAGPVAYDQVKAFD
ncbi:MAG TPA: flagellar hook capping FlgD N-terminal domain-containing protein [Burkholderiaceae bacterium]